MSKYVAITKLGSDEARAFNDLRFTVTCKNTSKLHTYKLDRELKHGGREIVQLLSWAIYKVRHSQGHTTRVAVREKFRTFLRFSKDNDINHASDLNSSTLKDYCRWLKNESGIKYSAAGNTYRSLVSIFKQWQKHDSVSDNFIIPINMFPKSNSLSTGVEGYDSEEIKEILKVVVQALKDTAKRLESTYKPKYLGLEPPLHDVAPTIPGKKSRSPWGSVKQCIWFWVNELECKEYKIEELYKIPKGQSFLKGVSEHKNNMSERLANFYSGHRSKTNILIEQYRNKPAPIQYSSPWAKEEYLMWYWENVIECKVLSDQEVFKFHGSFHRGYSHHHPNWLSRFYKENNITKWIGTPDLVPYYLMLLIRTGLNPSTLSRLTVDCIEKDPLDPERSFINWEKYRSNKRDKTIPVERGGDSWPIRIIQRVIKITEPLRLNDEKELWLVNAGRDRTVQPCTMGTFQTRLREFGIRYELKRPSDGREIELKGSLFRPTVAWQEYLRTEDLSYLQSLLGHTRASTTSGYLRKLNDPIFKARRGLHQEAMLLGLESENEIPFQSIETIARLSENLHNHCKDPLHSPQVNQTTGKSCSASSEVCLGCQNLVITPLDIKKHFSFINYYETMLSLGEIEQDEFEAATLDKTYMWNTYILPKYECGFVERIQTDAQHSPVAEWQISSAGS